MATLTDILTKLFTQAELHPGEPQRYMLDGGLRVDVKVEKDLLFLQVSRGNTWPADQEMQTVIQYWHWPRPPAPPVVKRRFYLRRYYLWASWPVPIRFPGV